MTDAQPSETEKNTGGHWPALRVQFSAAARRVFNKKTLKLAAPLLMTTALVSDSYNNEIAQIPVWGHSVAPQSGAGWPARTAPEGISNIVRCYAPRTQEAAYSFNAAERSWHGFYTLSSEGGATGRLLHAASLRDPTGPLHALEPTDAPRFARTGPQSAV